MPRAFAALTASRQIAATLSPSAGVMPVKWNRSAPSKILSQSKSAAVGCAVAFRLHKPIVSLGCQTQHDLSESDDPLHISLFLTLLTKLMHILADIAAKCKCHL